MLFFCNCKLGASSLDLELIDSRLLTLKLLEADMNEQDGGWLLSIEVVRFSESRKERLQWERLAGVHRLGAFHSTKYESGSFYFTLLKRIHVCALKEGI